MKRDTSKLRETTPDVPPEKIPGHSQDDEPAPAAGMTRTAGILIAAIAIVCAAVFGIYILKILPGAPRRFRCQQRRSFISFTGKNARTAMM